MPSIRQRLLVYLLGLFLFSWLMVAGITYMEATHEIEEIFDAQLAQTAGMIAALSLSDTEHRDINNTLTKAVYGHVYERKVSFQIWKGDELLLKTQSAPGERLSHQLGYSDRPIGKTTWRIFGTQFDNGKYTIYTAENHEIRDELIAYIVRSVLLPLSWALPLLGTLIWFGVGRGLQPLKRVAREVTQRNPRQLDPISEHGVPNDILPLTNSLNNLLQRLQHALEMEKRFTADASHELRTPLAVISTQAQIALRAKKGEERAKALRNILAGVDRSSRLVEQMLTLARLEPESVNQELQPVDLVKLAETAVAALVPLADEHGIELAIGNRHSPEECCTIDGLEPSLAILLRNLIDNAIRYTPAGGNVEIAISNENNHCCLVITDTGPGIPENEQEKIFDRFYRPNGQSSPGSGLGLSIAKRVAELHNTQIHFATSPSGRGLEVTLRFPCRGNDSLPG